MIVVDPLVYKLKLPRILKLLSGCISVNLLLLCIRYNDWLILIDNTIYTMTLDLYYSYRTPSLQLPKVLTLNQLYDALNYTLLTALDKLALLEIKDSIIGCSSCSFKNYARKATLIVNSYPLLILRYKLRELKPVLFKYPLTKLVILPKVSKLRLLHFLKLNYTRKPCFDCVAKHIGTAYIKALEVLQGYTEHNTLSLADLQLAYLLCPNLCVNLKKLLLYCISKSIKDGIMFVPVSLLAKQLDLAKLSVKSNDIAHLENLTSLLLLLELTLLHIDKIRSLDIILKSKIRLLIIELHNTLDNMNLSVSTTLILLWSGYLARLALLFSTIDITISNILRNRRLLFKALPKASRGSLYDCSDILNVINQSHQ